MNRKFIKTVKFIFTAGIIAETIVANQGVAFAGTLDNLNRVEDIEERQVTTIESAKSAKQEAIFTVNTVDDLRCAFQEQQLELNETFFLNINTELDVKQAVQQFEAGLTFCSWKFQYRVDSNGNRITTEYILYMFTVAYRDDVKVLQAYRNPELTVKLTTNEAALLEKAQYIINNIIKPGMLEYEKILAIHDYIVLNGQYALNAETPEQQSALYKAEGILMYGMGVCSSYAGSMYLLLGMIDIECEFITGVGQNSQGLSELHAWNKVKMNGEWYNFDVTWDDPSPNRPSEVSYAYFGVTDAMLSANHIWNQDIFPQSATSERFNYYRYNNLYAEDYNQFKTMVSQTLSAQKENTEITVRLYVKNYDTSVFSLDFIFDILPDITKVSYTKMTAESGEFIIRLMR